MATLFQQCEQRAQKRQELRDLENQVQDILQKFEAAKRATEQEDAVIVSRLVEEVDKITGSRYTVVPKKTVENTDDNGYETADEMEKAWNYNDVLGFIKKHQCVLVTNSTTSDGKKLVFALFTVDGSITYKMSDVYLAQAMLAITKLIRGSAGNFNVLDIRDGLKVSVPRNNPYSKTSMSTYCGCITATKNCARGCEFCKSLFVYDKRRPHFGNREPDNDDDDDEEVPKKRCRQSSSSD